MSLKKTTTTFIADAIKVHGDKYDYSKAAYKNAKVKVEIVCKTHGSFTQTPDSHCAGRGCPSCAGAAIRIGRGFDKHTFDIDRAKKKHGDKYDYSKVVFSTTKTSVSIICPIHGEFKQPPERHYAGCGCPTCGRMKSHDSRKSTAASFEISARKVHGDKYDYSKVEYIANDEPVIIVCQLHGEFSQQPSNHLQGKGCKGCADIATGLALRHDTATFIKNARLRHGDKYDYSKVEYVTAEDRVTITCKTHGDFSQSVKNHLGGGSGCPACANSYGPSKGEQAVFDYVKSLCPDAQQSVLGLLDGRHEVDIFIPSKNIAIEFNGLIWHSEKYGKDRMYHQRKTDQAAKKGIRLIHIWSDEWAYKREWCLGFLDRLCGIAGRKVMGRKCKIESIDSHVARQFLDDNHLQGFRTGAHVGMTHDGELVAVATYGNNSVGEMELIRWCVKIGVSVVGGFSKMMKQLPANIVSYCDTAKHDASGYLASGWEIIASSAPSYHYTDGKVRLNRQRFQKHKLLKNPDARGDTERELAASLNYYQIGGLRQLKLKRA